MPSPSDWGFQWLKAVAQERTLTPIAKVIATAFVVQFANDEICQINPSNATLAAYVGTLMPAVKQAMEIHLLSGHDFAKPMASLGANTLTLTDTPEALLLEAWIDPALAGVTYVTDILAGIRAGLTIGISPGFRVASIAGAEDITRSGNTVLRTVHLAHLEEISIVTRPAYPDAQIEARSWGSATIADRCDPTFRYRKWRSI